jgi:hypothetical protein
MKIDQKISFSISLVIDLENLRAFTKFSAPYRTALQQVISLAHTPLQGVACVKSRSPQTGRRCSPVRCGWISAHSVALKHCRAKAFTDNISLGASAARTTGAYGVTRSRKGVNPLNSVQAGWIGISSSKSRRG